MKISIWKNKWFWVGAVIVFVICIIIILGRGGNSGAKSAMMEDAIMSSAVRSEAAGSGMNMPQAMPGGVRSASVASKEAIGSTSASVSSQRTSWGASKASSKQMVISTADVILEVENLFDAYKSIREIAVKGNGYITSSNVSSTEGRKAGTMTIRLPVTGYEQGLEKIRALGKVISSNETGDDVTEEYVDLQSRIKNLRIEEATFQKLMKDAKQLQDILTVEEQLTRIRGEIEQVTGRMKLLEKQVSLSTINISFSEPVPSVARVVDWDINRSADGALNTIKAIGRAIVTLGLWLLIVFVPIGLVLLVISKIVRRWMRKRNTSERE